MSPRILQPAGWPSPRGYTNGMVAEGKLIFLAGQIGWNARTGVIETDDFLTQVGQAFRNIATVLAEAGARPDHVVRLTWYITDREAYLAGTRDVGRMYREVFGRHFPPMSVVIVSGLLEPRAKVEIEATAVVPRE